MSEAAPPSELMRLSGYIPLTDHGFALPAYRAWSLEQANAWYIAVPEIEGDRRAAIDHFDVLELEVTCGITTAEEISAGDTWKDVFLWRGETYVGSASEIFERLASEQETMLRTAPMTFLDLAVGACEPIAAAAARASRELLEARFGRHRGAAAFREIVLRPGLLLELQRWYHILNVPALPEAYRSFVLRDLGSNRFNVRLAPGTATLLGGPQTFDRLKEGFSAFGNLIGVEFQASEANSSDSAEDDTLQSDHPKKQFRAVDPEQRGFIERQRDRFGTGQELAIDIGTVNTRVVVKGGGAILTEPSVVALHVIDGILAFRAAGNEALEAKAESPRNVDLVWPVRAGVIVDSEVAGLMVKYFIRMVWQGRVFRRRPHVVVSVPLGSTSVQRRAFYEAMTLAGANRVSFVEQPMAAAAGAGMGIERPVGSIIIDIGAGRAEIVVLTLHGDAYATTLHASGDRMDEAIVSYVRRHHGIAIEKAAATELKERIGAAVRLSSGPGPSMPVSGRDLNTSISREIVFTQREAAEAISEIVKSIVEGIRTALDHTAPELAADILDQGVTLTGGGARLKGLAQVLHEQTGLPVRVAPDPEKCAVKGITRVIEEPALRNFLYGT